MTSVNQVAKEWAKMGLAESSFSVRLRANYRALAAQSIAAGGLDSVTQATKNGVQMGKTIGLSPIETMSAMRIALEWIDRGYITIQSRSLGRF
jgi:hypothetical protein